MLFFGLVVVLDLFFFSLIKTCYLTKVKMVFTLGLSETLNKARCGGCGSSMKPHFWGAFLDFEPELIGKESSSPCLHPLLLISASAELRLSLAAASTVARF